MAFCFLITPIPVTVILFPVLTYALTAKNQYNTLPLEQAASIIEIAQAADFHTVWISNQVKYGAWDTPVSVIADQSQTQYWLNGHLGETTQTTHFDLSLVDVLKKTAGIRQSPDSCASDG